MLLNIKVADLSPPVWRLLRISERSSFSTLHQVLCLIFDWPEIPAHFFRMREAYIGPPEQDAEFMNERKVALADRIRGARFRAFYFYGEEDQWQLEITLAETAGAEEEPKPAVLDGARRSPPAELEGPVDYGALTEALGDPADPDHAQAKSLLGSAADLERFDVDEVNARLQAVGSETERPGGREAR